jgi:hypothetical protein
VTCLGMRFVYASLRARPIGFGPAKTPSKQTHIPQRKTHWRNKKILRTAALANIPHEIRGVSQKLLPSLPRSFPSFLPPVPFIHEPSPSVRRVVNPFYLSPRPARGIDVVKNSFQQKPGRSFLSLFGVSCHSLTSTVQLSFTSTSSIEK